MSTQPSDTNLTKISKSSIKSKRVRKRKMSIIFDKADVEAKFRQCVEKNDSSNVALMNQIVETVFNLENIFSEDASHNLEEVAELLNMVDWRSLHEIKIELQANPLTRNATLKDVTNGMILEGMESYRGRSTKASAA